MGIWYNLEQETKVDNISTSVLASFLLSYEGDLNKMSVKMLCEKSKVSYATPTRLAQKMGYNGFPELKYVLVNETKISTASPFNSQKLDITDYRNKLNLALDRSLEAVTEEQIEYIAKAFITYERIKIYGIGQSHHVATGLHARLIRFNKMPICPVSESEIFTSSRLANDNDLVVAISYSGHTETVMEPLKFCYKNGVKTILFTANPNIKDCATDIICLDLIENEVSNYSKLSKIVLEVILDFVYLKIIELDETYREFLTKTSMHK